MPSPTVALARLRHASLSRLCATLFAVLILLPFSAPFATCDLNLLMPGGDHSAAGQSSRHAAHQASLESPAAIHAVALRRSLNRHDHDAPARARVSPDSFPSGRCLGARDSQRPLRVSLVPLPLRI